MYHKIKKKKQYKNHYCSEKKKYRMRTHMSKTTQGRGWCNAVNVRGAGAAVSGEGEGGLRWT